MIDNFAGVKKNVAFSLFDAHLTIRTDGDKDHCRFSDVTIYAKTKKEAAERFSVLCCARQNANTRHRHTSNEKKSYECENCKCGLEILKGKRKTLPLNIGWGKWTF